MRYLDVCAGISASTVAWKPLGWEAAAYSEIEPAPRAILAHHYPDTPLHGDFTTIRGDEYGAIDLLVGGTPCQDFSVAGLRAGLDGDRGNLSLEFLRLADRTRPRWLVWENVPGVLSIDGGRAFGAILGGLGELGYGVAYRILDAQHFGVPQRRRRVFVVGYLGDWRRAAAVLFERHSLSGHSAPRRQARAGITDCAPFGPGGARDDSGRAANGRPAAQAFGGGANCHPTDVATAVAAHPGGRYDIDCETFVAEITGTLAAGGNTTGGNRYPGMSAETADTMLVTHALRGEGFDASEDGTGRGTPLVPVSFTGGASDCIALEDCAHPVTGRNGDPGMIAFDTTQITNALNRSPPKAGGPCHPLAAGAHPPAIAGSAVRRLTPRECERLQGFPDDYTLVPYRKGMMADGPRYKALGNSMAVPVMRWIGERIAAVESLPEKALAA
jgi:DNA (cytosine-5)-methyltransferase 1